MVCSVEGGMVGEEWIGSKKSWMVMSKECWWRKCWERRSKSCVGVGRVLVWVGLFTLGTVIIGVKGRGVVTLCTAFAWLLFTVFTVGEHLHVWSKEAYTGGEACCLRRLE